MKIFSKSESWHIKKNDTLGKASALAVMRRTDEYSNYCWTPLDYLGDDGESGQARIQNVFLFFSSFLGHYMDGTRV